ncbi:MAG: YcgN family cysteine cluster protein [Xanthobacteraceae bacterium]
MADTPFWKTKSLAEMTDAEWESLCDGCGRCCLVKLEDEDDGTIHFTDIGCRLLDGESCRCRDYKNRTARVDDCVRLTAENLSSLNWLPPTCAYRLLANGGELYWWHPLVSGDPETVHGAGISVRSRVAADEDALPEEKLADHIVAWPRKWPKGTKSPVRPPSRELARRPR